MFYMSTQAENCITNQCQHQMKNNSSAALRSNSDQSVYLLNPVIAGLDHLFYFLISHLVPAFEHVKDKT